MSQSIQDIPVGDILPLDHVLQLADRSKLLAARVQEFERNDGLKTPEELRVLTSTMDEVEQTLRPYTMAVLDCILGDIYENILLEQDGTRAGFDEAMTRITRTLRPALLEMDSEPNDSTHTFSLDETPEIVERFQRLILGFEDLDRLVHQPVHNTLVLSEQQVETCVEAGRVKVLMGCVFDAIVSQGSVFWAFVPEYTSPAKERCHYWPEHGSHDLNERVEAFEFDLEITAGKKNTAGENNAAPPQRRVAYPTIQLGET
ncbi:hypothetical protein Landi51_06138 [Colletotrichum acutatum]